MGHTVDVPVDISCDLPTSLKVGENKHDQEENENLTTLAVEDMLSVNYHFFLIFHSFNL